jgi:hypothetical protein
VKQRWRWAIQQDYSRSIVGVEGHGDSFLAYLGVIGHWLDIPILPELLNSHYCSIDIVVIVPLMKSERRVIRSLSHNSGHLTAVLLVE